MTLFSKFVKEIYESLIFFEWFYEIHDYIEK